MCAGRGWLQPGSCSSIIMDARSIESFLEMVYVDRIMTVKPNKKYRWWKACHLTADCIDELHLFACKLGLKAEFAHKSRSGVLHYDLCASKRRKAVVLGAREI